MTLAERLLSLLGLHRSNEMADSLTNVSMDFRDQVNLRKVKDPGMLHALKLLAFNEKSNWDQTVANSINLLTESRITKKGIVTPEQSYEWLTRILMHPYDEGIIDVELIDDYLDRFNYKLKRTLTSDKVGLGYLSFIRWASDKISKNEKVTRVEVMDEVIRIKGEFK